MSHKTFTGRCFIEEIPRYLKKLFYIEEEVVQAYLLQYQREDDVNIRYMIAIETEGSFERIAGKAIITAEGSVAKGTSIDFVEMDPESGIKEGLEGDFQPFYIRRES